MLPSFIFLRQNKFQYKIRNLKKSSYNFIFKMTGYSSLIGLMPTTFGLNWY